MLGFAADHWTHRLPMPACTKPGLQPPEKDRWARARLHIHIMGKQAHAHGVASRTRTHGCWHYSDTLTRAHERARARPRPRARAHARTPCPPAGLCACVCRWGVDLWEGMEPANGTVNGSAACLGAEGRTYPDCSTEEQVGRALVTIAPLCSPTIAPQGLLGTAASHTPAPQLHVNCNR